MPDKADDIQRLVERLRGPCVDYDKTDMLDGAEPLFMDCGTLREAANEIERLYMLAKANNDLARRHADTITALRAEVARMREALERIVDAPMIDHANPERGAQAIARAALSSITGDE